MNKSGKIIRIISNLYTVLTDDGKVFECRARGKFRQDKISPLVGDFVVIDSKNNYILEINTRKNELSRPSIANVDAALIVTSVKNPNISLNLLDKEILCVACNKIKPIIVLTKTDLLSNNEKDEINEISEYYQNIGYKVITNQDIDSLLDAIKNMTVVLTGQTGAGKSTLLNKLDEKLDLKTSPISKALGRGVHTTRHTELFRVQDSFIADTPGFSALDIPISADELKDWYPEFQNVKCKFDDCMHDKEKICGVKDMVSNGKIRISRYENYIKFRGELK